MLDKVISILSARYQLDPEIIEKIIRSEFKFVQDTMEQGNFESVHLHHFGKYAVKPKRLEQLQNRNESI